MDKIGFTIADPSDVIKITPGGIRPVEIGNLVAENATILRRPCPEWVFDDEKKAMHIARLLIDTGKAYGALGIAAPQIGYNYRVFAIGSGDQWQVCFNPKIETVTDKQIGPEGCLSFPGLKLTIKRYKRVDVRFQMPNGEEREETYEDLTARCFQHEMDHLDGIVFTSKVGELSLMRAREKRRKFIKQLERRGIKHGT